MSEEQAYDPSMNKALIIDPPKPSIIPSIEEMIAMIVKKKEKENMLYKYAENEIISDFHDYIDKTYEEHYKTNIKSIECFDAWIALGDSTDTFRNTALKYLWRYGKKNGKNKADLMKALHYTLMCLYVDHYKDGK
jgi:hypothetical protein